MSDERPEPNPEDESLLDKLRHAGVGTDDTNSIGDAEGGTDVAPGHDQRSQ